MKNKHSPLRSSLKKKSSFALDVKDPPKLLRKSFAPNDNGTPTCASKAAKKVAKPPAQASRRAAGCFLKKQPATIAKKTNKGPKQKFATFFKVRLPRVTNPFGPLAEAEVVQSSQMHFKIIWKFDPHAVVLACRGSSTATLTKDADPLSSRSQLQLHVSNVSVKQDMNTWIKVQVAHDEACAEFEEDRNFQGSLQEADLWFHPDKVQARSTASISWLLGSTPDSCDVNDMKASHEAHPDLGVECEPGPQNIRLCPGKNNIPADQQVKAIHVCVTTENVPLRRPKHGKCCLW